jgi:uncharacterized membrane protein
MAVILALTPVSVAIALLGWPTGVLRTLVMLPLALLAPGYVLSQALFPRRHTLDAIERVAITIGLSLVVAIAGGLLLNTTPWGLQAGTWAIWLALVTWGGSLAAIVRRQRLPIVEAPALRMPAPGPALTLGLAILVGAAALALAIAGSGEPRGEPFTQLWMVPEHDDVRPMVRLGLRNMEGIDTTYRMVLRLDDEIVREWPVITLPPGEAAESLLVLPATAYNRDIRADLYLAQTPDVVYRRVHARLEQDATPRGP